MPNVPIRPDLIPAKSSLDEQKNPGSETSDKQIQKVTKGEVIVKKPSAVKKLVNTFIVEVPLLFKFLQELKSTAISLKLLPSAPILL